MLDDKWRDEQLAVLHEIQETVQEYGRAHALEHQGMISSYRSTKDWFKA